MEEEPVCICTIVDGKTVANFFCHFHGFVAANQKQIAEDKARRSGPGNKNNYSGRIAYGGRG